MFRRKSQYRESVKLDRLGREAWKILEEMKRVAIEEGVEEDQVERIQQAIYTVMDIIALNIKVEG